MKPSTLERALHMWPEWSESIHRARERFNFAARRPLGPDNWDWKWHLENQLEVYRFALAELDRLALPRGLAWYWQCCFYVDYERPDGSVDYEAIVDWVGAGIKVYPSLWHIDYQPPDRPRGTLRLETNVSLLTKRTLAELANEMLSYKRWQSQSPHPLLELIHRAKVGPGEKKRKAIARFGTGVASFSDLLREEWEDGDVQARLADYERRHAKNPQVLAKQISGLRKEVYNRVYGWLYSRGIKPPRLTKEKW